MHPNIKISLLVLLCLLSRVKLTLGQFPFDTTRQYRDETSDGNEYFGKILLNDSSSIRFNTSNIGIITIQKKYILKIEDVKKEQIIEGEIWYEIPMSGK